MADADHKPCIKCAVSKPLTEFAMHPKVHGGRRNVCRQCDNAAVRARRAASERTRLLEREFHRARRLRLHFGMTVEEYDQLLERQGGKCAICEAPPEGFYRHPVDHCHETGRIRGILCGKCNKGLGLLGDTAERLAKALSYISQ